MVNGPHDVWVEEHGKLRPAPEIRFRDSSHLLNVINTLLAPSDRRLDLQNSTVDAPLPDDERFPGGGRINAVLDPIALSGPVLTIRRFSRIPFSLERLVEFGSLTPEMAAFLAACVRTRRNILVSGGTGSGKPPCCARWPPSSICSANASSPLRTPPSGIWVAPANTSWHWRRARPTASARAKSRFASWCITRCACARIASSWARCAGLKRSICSRRGTPATKGRGRQSMPMGHRKRSTAWRRWCCGRVKRPRCRWWRSDASYAFSTL
ncbi:CpaF family protein [Candidatus Gracilibacteria bacterium]|nr:CpaF family protein [Candidatus Gracilibacteria bacterium]